MPPRAAGAVAAFGLAGVGLTGRVLRTGGVYGDPGGGGGSLPGDPRTGQVLFNTASRPRSLGLSAGAGPGLSSSIRCDIV